MFPMENSRITSSARSRTASEEWNCRKNLSGERQKTDNAVAHLKIQQVTSIRRGADILDARGLAPKHELQRDKRLLRDEIDA